MLPAFGNTPLAELDADRIGAWKATLMSDGLKPATVNTYLALLSTILGAGSTYTIAENDFMVTGGDGYPNFSSRATTRDIMDQVVADHIAARSPISPAIQARINCTTSGATACPMVTP